MGLSRDHLPGAVRPQASGHQPAAVPPAAHRPTDAPPAEGAPAQRSRAHPRHAADRSTSPEVDDRKIDGHWEGDLVMGTRPSAIATLVERTSRLVRLVAVPDGIKAHQVRPHLTHAALQIPPHLRRTLTWDRGREMAEHALFTADTAMPAYFCKRLRLKWREPSSTGACLPLP
ncbi:IS30 family transposase [Actinomadura bangladeshensis]|uniref:IS30 family transposase n=1 Tax=Actinomadura bangladeshensis TaxID=453573 RepID=A0A6L9QM71_9ACTN|nr:IS30 family transposase [Actinomadura bangladeshensis]